MAQINQFQKPEKDPLDTVIRGLEVARNIYGIKADMAKIEQAKIDREYELKKRARDEGIMGRKQDPQSPVMQTVRTMGKKAGVQIPDTMTEDEYAASPLKTLIDSRIKGDEDRRTADAKRAENPNKAVFDQLPPENQEVIKDLARKNANKSSIKSQIDSPLEILKNPEISESQKIKTGQNLLKTLNSTEGQDAVGAEESKRLGSFLEYKIANFTQPGSFVGRDLNEFVTQVELKSGEIGQAIQRNQQTIDERYGRASQQGLAGIRVPEGAKAKKPKGNSNEAQAGTGGETITAEDTRALQEVQRRLMANPQDPVALKSADILKRKGLKVQLPGRSPQSAAPAPSAARTLPSAVIPGMPGVVDNSPAGRAR